jgi:peptide/nickel transport system permease protein
MSQTLLDDPSVVAAGTAARSGRGTRGRALGLFLRSPLNLAASLYVLLVVAGAGAASLVAPYDPVVNDLAHSLEGPSAQHWLGTDQLGRDVLSRLLYGGRPVLLGVLEATAIALVVGLALGATAGYHGRWLDAVVSRVVDVWLSVPAIVVLLLVLSVFGSSQTAAMVTLGLLFAPALLRVARGATIAVRHELYISAARVFGTSSSQIVLRHVLPRIAGPVVINTAFVMAHLVLVQSGLAFLGLTVRPPDPSWGGMVTDASQVLQVQPWLILPSGGVIAVTVLALVVLGDGVRDATQDARSTSPRTRRAAPAATSRVEAGASEPGPRPLLRVQDLQVQLPLAEGWTPVVDGVSFDVHAGETLGLVGESGSGKSVAALSVLGLPPGDGAVTSGSVVWDGQDLSGLTVRAYREVRGREIAYVSQEPMASLDPSCTIGSQLSEAVRRLDRLRGGAARARVLELLALVGLPDPEQTARRYPHQISGGMAQRVVIARALAGRPRLLIADEPTTALDSTVQRGILELLRRLQRETGMAVVLVTHDWGVVAETCDRAVVMYAGQVVEQSEVAELFEQPRHPYTAALLASDPHCAAPGEPIAAIQGSVPRPGDWPGGCRFAPRCALRVEACTVAEVALEVVGGGRTTRCLRTGELAGSGR